MLFSASELFLIAGITLLILFECVMAVRSHSWVQIYRPTLFVAVVLTFYVLVGPIRAVLSSGETANFIGTSGTIYRYLEHRPYLIWGWLGALVFYASLLAGFYSVQPRLNPSRLMSSPDLYKIRRWGQALCWVGTLMYSLVQGPRILLLLNPLGSQSSQISWGSFTGVDMGPFENYFFLAINLLIPGIVLQFAVWLRLRKDLWITILWLAFASLIYLSEAFRYRILLLLVPILLLWFFYNKRRPMLIGLIFFMVGFISLNGLVGAARSRLRGLDVDKISGFTPEQIVKASFEETGVFFTTSVVIDSVPSRFPFIGLEPIITTLAQPIPRKLFPSKPLGNYGKKITDPIYDLGYFSGVTILGYGEYYLIHGWTSLIFASFLIGSLLRRVWTWFLWRQYEPLAQSIYLLNSSYLYVVVSRGYLPQVIMLYVFTVMPLFFIYWVLSGRK